MSVNPISIFGILLIIFGCGAITVKKIDSKVMIVILTSGVALIIFTDQRVTSFKCNSSGCGWERVGLPDTNSELKYDIVKNSERLKIQSSAIESKIHEINTAIKQVNNESKKIPIQLPSPNIQIPPQLEQADRGIVSVFYRDGMDAVAKNIVSDLRKNGYQATAANSSLKEIE